MLSPSRDAMYDPSPWTSGSRRESGRPDAGGDPGDGRARRMAETLLRATLSIANPRGLVPLDTEREHRRAAQGLGERVRVDTCSPTLTGILSGLHQDCDLLYLVCRVSRHKGELLLWLESEKGLLAHVLAHDLAERIIDTGHLPRLLILLCHPAGSAAADDLLADLGKCLLAAGLASVLVLPADPSQMGLNQFLAVFFQELASQGAIDKAVAAARASLGERAHGWQPMLFDQRETVASQVPQHTAVRAASIGTMIGPYHLERKLGEGGMGTVYLGRRRDDELEMAVAVKLANECIASKDMLQRFRLERQLLADLKHPHIAMLLDAGTTPEGHPYFIMEHIEGHTIDSWCSLHQPSLRTLLRLFRKVLAAVGFAHAKGVIHRDIKPRNLMVTQEREPKLLDFGIARMTKEDEGAMTRPGELLLTPEYAAPEQLKGLQVSYQCDIYALGLVLLELLKGKRPTHWGCAHLEAVTRLVTEGRTRRDSGNAAVTAIPGTATLGQPNHVSKTATRRGDKAPAPVLTSQTDILAPSAMQALTAELTGAPLTAAGDRAATSTGAVTVEEWGAGSEAHETVPEALGHVLRTALANNPVYRFSSAAEFIAGLDRVLATLPEDRPVMPKKSFDTLMWYHPEDRAQVEAIARRLSQRGLAVWLDLWHLRKDMDYAQEMGKSLDASRACLVFLGSAAPWTSDLVTRDRVAFRQGDLHLFPVLLPGAHYPEKQSLLPSFLRGRVWTSLTGPDEKELNRLTHALEDIRHQGDEVLVPSGVCPFRGLEVFREQDKEFFFGREATAQRIIQHLTEHPFIGVLGPSGSGKSSVVRAGVMPHLREQGNAVALMTPSAQPLMELAFTLQHLFAQAGRVQPAEILLLRLRASREALHFIVRELFEEREGQAYLVIDQFEEIFTLATDVGSRDHFVALLCHALDQPRGRLSIVLTMRSDFLGKNTIFPDLDNYLLDHSLQVLPMSGEDLSRAIEAPARLAGLRLEPGLLDRILNDVAGAAGELPLLEHALLELYERRDGGLLTWQAYEEVGGIEGALARRAESEYNRLDPCGRETLRKMFTLCLVQPGEGVEDTRRRATRDELLAVSKAPAVVEALLDRWMQVRLLTGSGEEGRDRVMVDVAHEALIRRWGRIRTWMDEDRDTARLLGQLRQAARAWEESGRNGDLLLRGAPLLQMNDLVKRESAYLGPQEKSFVVAGLRQSQRRRRLAILVGCLGFVLAAITFSLFLVASSARRTALTEKNKAEQSNREGNFNLAMMFEEKAGQALAEYRPQEAWLFAMAALSRDIPPEKVLPGSIGRFADPALNEAGRMRWSSPVATPVDRVAYNPAGTLLALAGTDHKIRLLDPASGGPQGVLIGHTSPIAALAFSPDGRWLASAAADRDVRLWRVPDGNWEAVNAERIWSGQQGWVTDLVFTTDGRRLIAASSDGAIRFWNVASGALVRYWPGTGGGIGCLALSVDGQWLAYGRATGVAGMIATDSEAERSFSVSAGIFDLCFVSGRLALACADGRIRLVDPLKGEPVTTWKAHQRSVVALAFLPRENKLVSLGGDGTMAVFDPTTGATTTEWRAFAGAGTLEREDEATAEAEAVETPAPEADADDEDENDDDGEDDEVEPAGGERRDVAEIGNAGSLSVSAGGRMIAGALAGDLPIIWDRAGANAVATVSGHAGDVLAVAFAPDGLTLASASGDGTVKLWDVVHHEEIATLRGHLSEVVGLCFSPDGRVLASASGDTTIKLWDGKSHRLIATLNHHAAEVTGVAFSPDGTLLASSSLDGTAILWDAVSYARTAILSGHAAALGGVTFAPGGKLLATASADKTLKLWHRDGRLLATLHGHSANVVSVAFSPDGRILASGSDDQTLRLWDVATLRPLATMGGHLADVAMVVFSPDGSRLASASDDLTVRLWDVAGRKPLTVLAGHAAPVVGVAFSPDGRLLASASEDASLRLWDIAERSGAAVLDDHDATVIAVAFSPDGRTLASTSEDRSIRLWDTVERQPKAILKGHQADVTGAAFSPDGQWLASSADDRSLRLWQVTSGSLVRVFEGHTAEVTDVVYAPDGSLIASSSDDGTVRLWDPAGGSAVATLSDHNADVVAVNFSPDGSLLASASDDRTVRLWDVVRRVEIGRLIGHSSEVTDVAFSPDGRLLASAGTDQIVRIWDVRNQLELAALSGHSKWVNGLAWCAGGNLLASSSGDGSVRLWQINDAGNELNCRPFANLLGHEGEVFGLAFSAQGLLASASGDTTIRLWQLGDLQYFLEENPDRNRYAGLFRRSLFHFGYRLDGFQMAYEPRFGLSAHGAFHFSASHAYGDLARPRAQGQRLIDWLAGARHSEPSR